MRILLFTLLSLACSGLLAATVYRWVDENGVVHYSDQSHANAEKVQISAPQTFRGQQSNNAANTPPRDPQASAPAPAYAGCAIAQPFEAVIGA